MTTTPRQIHERIEEIYRSGLVRGEDGTQYPLGDTSVTAERGKFIGDLCRTEHAARALEIGMAWGLSTLFILAALAENGAGPGAHAVTDPFQFSRWHGAGLRTIRELGADAMIEFHEQRSELLLPELIKADRRFDFILIDGDHRFDGVFVDFVLVNRLLKPGGLVIFDDAWFDPVYLTCCYAETNCGYTLVAQHPDYGVPSLSGRPDQGVQICAYRKPAKEAPRGFFDFVPFFDGIVQRGEKRLLKTGMRALTEGDSALARRCFLGALRIKPFRLKTYGRLLRTFLPLPFARALTRRKVTAASTPGGVSP
ncbi:MAG TPA: class I SAM-dependent methyltransferase [Candidatus Binataceae bacterium]|nr:class I SAM-dependent methyltransferase [Candidatus Binataceae bacterium]